MPNLKYLGLNALGEMVKENPTVAANHQMAVMNCLSSDDEALKRKAIDLLFAISNENNVQVVIDKMLDFLKTTNDEYFQILLITRVNDLAERFAPNPSWYIKTITQLFLAAGDVVPSNVASTVMKLLEDYNIPTRGRHAVVIGRSNIVGKPMAALLTRADGTVTLCHSKTPDLADITRQADILVSAVGKVNCVTADMVKDGAVVIDVAMNRNEAGKLCGDVDFAAVEPKASYITPVPGGVGPMTRAMLMRNILAAAETRLK